MSPLVAEVLHAVVLLALAVAVAAFGWWGRAHAGSLVPAHVDEGDRARRTATLRRGAVACYAAAAVLAATAALALV